MNCKRCKLCLGTKNPIKPSRVRLSSKGLSLYFLVDVPTIADTTFLKFGMGPELDFLECLVREASQGYIKDFYYSGMVRCYPKTITDPFNYYDPSDVLKCSNWLYQDLEKIDPEIIILVGAEVTDFYKRQFKEAISIQHIRTIIKQGGTGSPYYPTIFRTLKERITDAQKKKNNFII